ncbi:hypothetical protein [Pedobacter sp. JY14-1]|uniref:hypothetical protein n=1 Tax=Pedobacter sp. JY14-1 TaxID=3034151 RepID=UPI0023E234BC|nr:hypothetical protein [Pedobacter sp. JY14-1]
MPKYTRQIVVFLDVLGFSVMLPKFEKEALNHSNPEDGDYHESESLNRLLTIFRDAINLIEARNCNYYLFSDNICITINYIVEDTEYSGLFVDILQLINILNYEFVKEGYFLRGGIDVGWFLDSRDIAAGMPLVNAYLLESKKAVYPRVLISMDYVNIINAYKANNQFDDRQVFILDQILISDDEQIFINYYLEVLNFEDPASKIDFLKAYKERISYSLNLHKGVEKIFEKYRWSAERFNEFLGYYIRNIETLEPELNEEGYLAKVETLKIN